MEYSAGMVSQVFAFVETKKTAELAKAAAAEAAAKAEGAKTAGSTENDLNLI